MVSKDIGEAITLQTTIVETTESFPIRELSARTGVNTVTIRAWERRFGLLKPQRTNKGHRLYCAADVRRVEIILMLVGRGVPLKKVKVLLEESHNIQNLDDLTADGNWSEQVKQLVTAAETFSSTRVEAMLNEQLIQYPPSLCLEKLFKPVFKLLQNNSGNQATSTFIESEILRYTLVRLSAKKSTKGKPTITLSHGDKAPLWRMAVICLELADAGYRVQLISQKLRESDWLAMTKATREMIHVFYQDGLWKEPEGQAIADTLHREKNLIICGTAPLVYNLKIANQVFANIEQYVAFQLTQKNE